MADQKRWFKLWCSAPSDDDLQYLPPTLRWAWAAFGCYTKVHGTRGRVTLNPTNTVLAAEMGVLPETLLATLKRLPHMRVEEGISDNGTIAVTWQNWPKYQEDSTVAERVSRLRSKRRGEKEKEENKKKSSRTSLSDEQFLTKLRTNPAYAHIDIDRELAKMDAWFLTPKGRGRQKTRQFVVNWLNKVDPLLNTPTSAAPYAKFPRVQ